MTEEGENKSLLQKSTILALQQCQKLSQFSKKGNWCCIQDFSPFVIVFVLTVFDKIVDPFKNVEKILI